MRSVAIVVVLAACGSGDDGGSDAAVLFPADYAASFVEVRNCRISGDHELDQIIVKTDPVAAQAYQLRDRAFEIGAIVLKEERDPSDSSCTTDIIKWTVMVRLATGSSPGTLDWKWQKVNADRKVISEDEPLCIGCHQTCGVPPDGYLGTCALP